MGGGPKKTNTDRLKTTCKLCREGIYSGDVVYWLREPVTGLVHCGCVPPPKDTAAEGGTLDR